MSHSESATVVAGRKELSRFLESLDEGDLTARVPGGLPKIPKAVADAVNRALERANAEKRALQVRVEVLQRDGGHRLKP